MTSPTGELTLIGRLVDASNGTFLAADEAQRSWVYKPVAGEAPLWDFPAGTLSRREVAAYELSKTLGLDVVPPTVWVDGPLGEGSAQAWVEGEPTELIDLLRPEELTEGWLMTTVGRTANVEITVPTARGPAPSVAADLAPILDAVVPPTSSRGGG